MGILSSVWGNSVDVLSCDVVLGTPAWSKKSKREVKDYCSSARISLSDFLVMLDTKLYVPAAFKGMRQAKVSYLQ